MFCNAKALVFTADADVCSLTAVDTTSLSHENRRPPRAWTRGRFGEVSDLRLQTLLTIGR